MKRAISNGRFEGHRCALAAVRASASQAGSAATLTPPYAGSRVHVWLSSLLQSPIRCLHSSLAATRGFSERLIRGFSLIARRAHRGSCACPIGSWPDDAMVAIGRWRRWVDRPLREYSETWKRSRGKDESMSTTGRDMVKRIKGFAAMSPERQREIASKGGKAAHEKGKAHEFTTEQAREAGRKGGLSVSKKREHMAEIGRKGGRAVSSNRAHMARIGRRGGAVVSANRDHMAEIGREGGSGSAAPVEPA